MDDGSLPILLFMVKPQTRFCKYLQTKYKFYEFTFDADFSHIIVYLRGILWSQYQRIIFDCVSNLNKHEISNIVNKHTLIFRYKLICLW